MDKKLKIICVVAVILILGFAIYSISPLNRSYSIDNAAMDLTVDKYAKLHVDEVYDYSFKGEYNGVYRDIPLKFKESIKNLNVSADGAYPVVVENESGGYTHLKIYLYSDVQHTQKIKDCNVRVHISYDMDHVVSVYDDVGVLQYKLWDKEWDVGVKHMDVKVHLPGGSGNSYYINPEKFTESSSMDGNTITINSNGVSQGEIYELLVFMPRDDFTKSALYAYHHDGNGKEMILNNLNESLDEINFWDIFNTIFTLLVFIGPVIVIYAYIKYGREPKVDYDGIYERELPSDDPPEVVNAIFSQSHIIGTPDREGFEASILNIIDKKVFEISTQENVDSDDGDVVLTIKNDKKDVLSSSEQIIFETLSHFAEDDVLNLSVLRKKLTNQTNAKWFMDQFETWRKQVKEENKEYSKKYFNNKGSEISAAVGMVGFIIAVIAFFCCEIFIPVQGARIWSARMSILMAIISVVIFFLPADYLGQWTYEGRILYLKWKNFKKFLEDNSLIKEHPPESIVIWKKYLIYGAAMGIADKVYDSMKIQVPNINEYDDGVFVYHSCDGFTSMHSAIEAGEYWSNPPSDTGGGSGGSGGFGGGSGGGGGGAF